MPSPFPGMDPYLEAPEIWPDFHDALAAEIRGELNRTLPSPYYARIEMRPEIGIAEARDRGRRVVPDVAVVRHPGRTPESRRPPRRATGTRHVRLHDAGVLPAAA